jgi:hypothetical protein
MLVADVLQTPAVVDAPADALSISLTLISCFKSKAGLHPCNPALLFLLRFKVSSIFIASP